MIRWFAVGLVPASVAVQAACLNPFGCGPSTLAECRAEAVKMPTDTGVRLAIMDCQKKFVAEPAELARAEGSKKIAAAWDRIKVGQSVTTDLDKLDAVGKVLMESKQGPCSVSSAAGAGRVCAWLRWAAVPNDGMFDDLLPTALVFQLEVDAKTLLIVSKFPTAMPARTLPWRTTEDVRPIDWSKYQVDQPKAR